MILETCVNDFVKIRNISQSHSLANGGRYNFHVQIEIQDILFYLIHLFYFQGQTLFISLCIVTVLNVIND
jgi:hypothetical protein